MLLISWGLRRLFLSAFLLLHTAHLLVSALGTLCEAPLGSGTAAPSDPFWLETIKHQGISAFNPDPASYQVFRNVKDFGAVGDGVTDDTAAINAAISAGSRCGDGCQSSTITPAVVYFPQGTYLVSSPIVALYYSQLIGDAKNPPTILAAPTFDGFAVIDANPYSASGQYYGATNNFFRSIRNFILDIRQVPATKATFTIHWRVAQATSLMNLVFEMSAAEGTQHQGVWMEDGSGGFVSDLVFHGGLYGMWVGNQQFTVRNVTIDNAQTAIFMNWNWGWTFQDVTITNCQVGFDIGAGAEGMVIVDADVSDTPIFVRLAASSSTNLTTSLVIDNAKLSSVPTAIGTSDGSVILAGGSTTIDTWAQGNLYTGDDPTGAFAQGPIAGPNKPSSLLDGSGKIHGRGRPQYEGYAVDQFVSVRDEGAKGDGETDDTASLQAVFDKYSGCKIIFIDAGTYIVTSTLTIPAGTKVVGEAWSTIAGKGTVFQDVDNPVPVVRVGAPHSRGAMEISDLLFSTIGPAPGAIIVEWNVGQPAGKTGATGMWDSHIRVGGSTGSHLEPDNCAMGTVNPDCFGAFLGLHLTQSSTAYLESTWVWIADHELDGDGVTQLSVFGGRGILSESAGPVWMIGTAEHFVLYQYSFVGASNHYVGYLQTETPYYQPYPVAPDPFDLRPDFHDPIIYDGGSAWAVNIEDSSDILIHGAGTYSFFSSLNANCTDEKSCQAQIVNVDEASQDINIYQLSTIGTTYQLSIDYTGLIDRGANDNGFASTITRWKGD